MADDTRNVELLVLIEESGSAQRMIVTWPKVHFDYREEMTVDYPGDLKSDDPFTARWSRICDVDIDDIERLAPVLFENGLLGEDGTIMDTVKAFMVKRGLEIVEVS